MKERPILFSGAMVRALLDGSKTQTRRAVKGAPLDWLEMYGFTPEFVANSGNGMCRYGQPGDRLFVRETWLKTNPFSDGGLHTYGYRATDEAEFPDAIWKPSIHMPRIASRITLEITSVRVERLQDISEADAQAEGVYTDPACPAYDAYQTLWDQINGPDSWAENPWVWVIEFKRVQP